MSAHAEDGTEVRIELAVRTLSPDGGGSQAAVLERLRSLEERGAIDGFDLTVWGKRVGLTTADAETDHGRDVIATVESFREWAADRDLSVGTAFETRRVDNRITGESYTALELPRMALAEYHGGDLRWVCPHSDPETGATRSVIDRVRSIETAYEEPGGSADARPAATVAEE